ncbi:MAG: NifU family protein [Streptosporangiaceae bacterium]
MSEASGPQEVGEQVERVLGQLRSDADPAVARRAEELVRLLVELYGAGLTRVVELVGEHADGKELLRGLADDELVGSLLVLHDLHPETTDERVSRALDQVRPYLGSHAGGVELLGVGDDGVVRLRLEGTCDGCPSSVVTVRDAIERAIDQVAPEVAGVEVEGLVEEGAPAQDPNVIPVGALFRECPVPEGGGTPR